MTVTTLTPVKGEALILLGVVPVLLHPRVARTDNLGQLAHTLQVSRPRMSVIAC